MAFIPYLPYPVTEIVTIYTVLSNFENFLNQLKQDSLPFLWWKSLLCFGRDYFTDVWRIRKYCSNVGKLPPGESCRKLSWRTFNRNRLSISFGRTLGVWCKNSEAVMPKIHYLILFDNDSWRDQNINGKHEIKMISFKLYLYWKNQCILYLFRLITYQI